jgi:hypothetical protein
MTCSNFHANYLFKRDLLLYSMAVKVLYRARDKLRNELVIRRKFVNYFVKTEEIRKT